MALIRELIRQARRGLGLVTVPTGDLNVDLYRSRSGGPPPFAQIGLEEYGMAPHFRSAVQAGLIRCLEYP
jgi:hypothetical protein